VTNHSFLSGCAATSWAPTGLTLECPHRAELAMRDADFAEQLAIVGDESDTAMLGRHGHFRAELHCRGTAKNSIISPEVTGPDATQAEWHRDTIATKF
jgi:hypothetical protein